MNESNLADLRKSNRPNVWVTLEKIQQALKWDERELSDHLRLTQKQFLQLRQRKMEPSLYSITELIDQVGLSIETIITGNIDYQALSAHGSGDLFYLPEQFQVGALSKRRTSINLLSYLEDHLGWKVKKNILNHFQVTEAIFSNPDDQINIKFPTDLCSYLVRSGYSPHIMSMMGAYSVVTNRNTALGQSMAKFVSPMALHERLFDGIVTQSYERNCTYQLMKLDHEQCVVQARDSEEVRDLLKVKKIGNVHVCAIRGGSFHSLPGYLNLPFSRIEEETCIHRGDAVCTYRIHYHHAQALAMNRGHAYSSAIH